MAKLGFRTDKVLAFSKNFLLPMLLMGGFFVYYFSIADFSEETYRIMHLNFLIIAALSLIVAILWRVPSTMVNISIIYMSYIIVNGLRYSYGEDYMFSAGYNIWTLLVIPDMVLAYFFMPKHQSYKYWSWFYIFIFAQTALIEKLQNQSIDADSYFFYRHIGMLNYPAFYISILCLIILLIRQIIKGRILNASTLFSAIAVFTGLYCSDNLFAFNLFFLSAVVIECASILFYVHYIKYKDEDLDLANIKALYKESEKKYPLKYSISLMCIDEYERLLKRFGANKMLILKKMFLNRIRKANESVLLYNYKADSIILAFMNANSQEAFNKAEEIRRILAKSIFVFNENNHLQLTVSQCVSEKKRSDADINAVVLRAEENLKKACKFTRNITIKA